MRAVVASAEFVADVDDAVSRFIEGNVQRGAVAAQSQRDHVAAAFVFVDEALERDVSEDVTVINDEALAVVEEVADIGDAARCFQSHRLMTKMNQRAAVFARRKKLFVAGREMMSVDDEFADADSAQMIEGISDQRLMEHWNERLRELLSQWSQPLSESSTQHKSLVHGSVLRSHHPRRKRKPMTETDRRIMAAQGYVELGLYNEARRELHPLPREMFDRSEVIELGLQCLMGEQRWSQALGVAHELCATAPTEPGGFIHAAYCLHEMERTLEALQVLKGGPKSLLTKPVFFYNLGCYNARLGHMDEAMKHLLRSFEMDRSLRKLARRDPDLTGVRELLQ